MLQSEAASRNAQLSLPPRGISLNVRVMTIADPFDAIADPNRRHLLEELRRAPKTVNELAEGLPISRPAVSQHLKALLDCNLVSVSTRGTRRIYAIHRPGFDRLNLWLDQFWS
jgi:DNA-binding transcriptional ArsR family regulator